MWLKVLIIKNPQEARIRQTVPMTTKFNKITKRATMQRDKEQKKLLPHNPKMVVSIMCIKVSMKLLEPRNISKVPSKTKFNKIILRVLLKRHKVKEDIYRETSTKSPKNKSKNKIIILAKLLNKSSQLSPEKNIAKKK